MSPAISDDKGKGRCAQGPQSEGPSFAAIQPLLSSTILAGLAALKLTHPTAVQRQFLPPALRGRDILAKARTGSGKTLAYTLPIIQGILRTKGRKPATDTERQATRAVVLVPTYELSEQVANSMTQLCNAIAADEEIRVANLAAGGSGAGRKRSAKLERLQLADKPDIVVATPSVLLSNLRTRALTLSCLTYLVLDEADLILSYGHSGEDIQAILHGPWNLPAIYQSFLMSATITGDVKQLEGIILRDPVTLDVSETEADISNLAQFSVRCAEEDKFLLTFVILRLKLIKGKCLIFVNSTDRSYRLKLFLEKFGIVAGVLNAELPFNSRYHAVEEFNRGVFNYLIATDESGTGDATTCTGKFELDAETGVESTLLHTQVAPTEGPAPIRGPETRKRKRREIRGPPASSEAGEYGVARGIDFADVACVLNFDLPLSPNSYTHRIGRTARAGRKGMSLSFIVPAEVWGKRRVGDISSPTAKYDARVWARIEQAEQNRGAKVHEYIFDMQQVEGFRYRMEDGLRSVTKAAVREARLKEIKNEILNSEKLKAHFEDHPEDLTFLKHDKPTHPSRVSAHMKHVPSYLMPRIAAVGHNSDADTTTGASAQQSPRVPFRNGSGSSAGFRPQRQAANNRGRSSVGNSGHKRKRDPLKHFK